MMNSNCILVFYKKIQPTVQGKAMTFRRRPAYPIGFLAMITVIVVSTAVLLWDLRKRELHNAEFETISITRMYMEQTERTFKSADLVLRGVQDRLQTAFGNQFTLDSVQVRLLLGTRVLEMKEFDELYLIDTNGQIVNSSLDKSTENHSQSNSDIYKSLSNTASSEMFIDKPIRNPEKKTWMLRLARRINGPDGKFRGIIVGMMAISHFENIYHDLSFEYARPVSLYRKDGILIASMPHREDMIGEKANELGKKFVATKDHDVHIFSHAKDINEREYFVLGNIQQFPLMVSVTNDDEEALASWRETAAPIIFGSTFISIFILFIAGLMLREMRKEEKLAQDLGEANERYHLTVDSVMDAIIAIDIDQNIILFNPASELMFGYSTNEIIGKSLSILIPESSRHIHQQHTTNFMSSSLKSKTKSVQLGVFGKRKNGEEFPIESTISQTLIGGKPQYTAVLRDITERRKAEDNLHEMNRQLRGLSASIQNVREKERKRIARELHDDLGQQLTGLKLDLSWISNRIKDGRVPSFEKIDDIRHQLDAAITSVRRISSELRPTILDDLGFGDAVNWQATEFAKKAGLNVTLKLEAKDVVQGDKITTALFRIVQESLTNIVRHASAKNVDIKLYQSENQLIMTITDDGIGMSETSRKEGFGLVGMRERVAELGGNFAILNSENSGTTIRVELSISTITTSGLDI